MGRFFLNPLFHSWRNYGSLWPKKIKLGMIKMAQWRWWNRIQTTGRTNIFKSQLLHTLCSACGIPPARLKCCLYHQYKCLPPDSVYSISSFIRQPLAATWVNAFCVSFCKMILSFLYYSMMDILSHSYYFGMRHSCCFMKKICTLE